MWERYMAATSSQRRTFYVELIKPSHYDDDGYVIQWTKSYIPSASLACLYGIVGDAKERKVLGEDVDIVVAACDETNTIVPIRTIIERFKANGNIGLVCLVGVQTNQFPRAVDIARQFRAEGIAVVVGGFHVSGCVSMLPELPSDIREAMDMGISIFAGEGEERRVDELLRAAYEHRLEPLYNFMRDLPGLIGQPTPFLPRENVSRYIRRIGAFDAGRGCPFTCSFCTIINVQGHKSRYRDADDVERLIRASAAHDVVGYFITDDNFARNKNWEAILDRMIHLREKEGISTSCFIQVDTLCHKIPNFIEKAARAGCRRVFIGLENINPQSLKAAGKGHNRITEYRKMLQAWRNVGVITYCGYLLGFPTDTPETIERDIRIIQRELPVDMLEFFILTPLPGSADHRDLHEKGVWMDPDMNKYDVEHVTTGHPKMSAAEWQGIYAKAWDLYYSWDHIETLLKRAVATGRDATPLMNMIAHFYGSFVYEGLHPLQGGSFRLKVRTQRRHGLPLENPLVFYARRGREVLTTYIPMLWFYRRMRRLAERIRRDPAAKSYTDLAITPVADENDEELEMFVVTDAARQAVVKAKARAEISRVAREKARLNALASAATPRR